MGNVRLGEAGPPTGVATLLPWGRVPQTPAPGQQSILRHDLVILTQLARVSKLPGETAATRSTHAFLDGTSRPHFADQISVPNCVSCSIRAPNSTESLMPEDPTLPVTAPGIATSGIGCGAPRLAIPLARSICPASCTPRHQGGKVCVLHHISGGHQP